MTRTERIVLSCWPYACGLLGLHALYYAWDIYCDRARSQRLDSPYSHRLCRHLLLSICIQILRGRPFGLLVVAAASYSGATFIEDFLVIESSFFLPEHPMAGSLYALRPLFMVMLVYLAVLRRSIETT